LDVLEGKIRVEAKSRAEKENRKVVEPADLAIAALTFAPGHRCSDDPGGANVPFWRRIAHSITGVTLIAGLLAISFGLIGYFAAKAQTGKELANGAWDIAKIFAGAVVGSTGAAIGRKS
jgi:hypothetical protein